MVCFLFYGVTIGQFSISSCLNSPNYNEFVIYRPWMKIGKSILNLL